jgi:hypothetical protein
MKDFNPSAKAELVEAAPKTTIAISQPAAPKAPRGLSVGIVDRKAAEAMAYAEDLKDGPDYGFHYPPSHFQDFAGPQSSRHSFQHLTFKLELLGDTSVRNVESNGGVYCASRGTIESREGRVLTTIQEIKAKLTAREQELKVDDAMIDEWLATSSVGAGELWWRMPFEQRIDAIRQGALS